MVAWGTTLRASRYSWHYGPVNVPFINGNFALSLTGEVADLFQVCSFVQQEGTGFGMCGSCALGALSGTKQKQHRAILGSGRPSSKILQAVMLGRRELDFES
jgi:hypothetical protein